MIDYSYPPNTQILHKKERGQSRERESRKQTKKQEDQAGARRKDREDPSVVESGEIVEVQVLKDGEIFDPDVFLDRFAQQQQTLPAGTLKTSKEPFRNPPQPTRGSTGSCTLALCIRTILYKRKRPTLSKVIGSSTNAPPKIVMSAVVWTM